MGEVLNLLDNDRFLHRYAESWAQTYIDIETNISVEAASSFHIQKTTEFKESGGNMQKLGPFLTAAFSEHGYSA